MEDGPSAIDSYILRLVQKHRPRICYVGTPGGDLPEGIEKFYAAFSSDKCEPSHLAFFRKPTIGSVPLADYQQHLACQDVIYVGGGNTKSALGVWREWNADKAFAEAYRAGALLCGVSAGALCWFDMGISDSYGATCCQCIPCLGFLRGACSVHCNADQHRREALHAAIENSDLEVAVCIDDYSALLYEDEALVRVLRWTNGAGTTVRPAPFRVVASRQWR